MQTRRDQLHAYKFMTRRAMSALVTGEPDSVEPPMRRLTITTISGIMVAILVAAVFAVIGLLKGGGGDDWKSDGSVVMEEETGARFVNVEGTLYPVLNYASAVLATGSTSPVSVQSVSRSDLASVERGQVIGIPELPDSMPASDELVRGPITVCSLAVAEGIEVRAVVEVGIGSAAPRPVGEDEALYVESFAGKRFLLFAGQRLPVDPQVEAALQINADPVRVGSAFLTAVPVGAALETPRIPGQGQPVPVGSRTLLVGQVMEVDDGTFRVVLGDGVAPVSDVQAKLLRTVKLGGQRRDPVQVALSEVLGLEESDGLAGAMEGLPSVMPTLSSDGAAVGGACAVYAEDDSVPQLALPDPDDSGGLATSESDSSQHGRADVVSLKPGSGLLASTSLSDTVYLIGEPGRAYPATSVATLGGFGYGTVEPVRLPPELLEIIPPGGALDPVKARTPAQ